ncbi:hypothetical protein ACOSQ4_021385 [Xanthoceras sorbifolium]
MLFFFFFFFQLNRISSLLSFSFLFFFFFFCSVFFFLFLHCFCTSSCSPAADFFSFSSFPLLSLVRLKSLSSSLSLPFFLFSSVFLLVSPPLLFFVLFSDLLLV